MREGRAGSLSRLTRRRLLTTGAATAAGLTTAAAWPARCNGKFYPGASILGVDLGGLSRAEALNKLQTRLSSFERNAISFQLGDRTWTASASDLGVAVDYQTSLDAAWQHGRGDGLRGRYLALATEASAVEPLTLTLDTMVLNQFLAKLDQAISKPARDAKLIVKGGDVRVRAAKSGVKLDVADTRERTLTALKTVSPSEITLRTSAVKPIVATSDLKAIEQAVATLVGSDVTIVHGDSIWTVSPEELTDALRLPDDLVHGQPALDATVLRKALSPIAGEINHPPRNATVAWDGGLYATSESYDGAAVDLDRLVADVITAAATTSRKVKLPLVYTPPAVDAAHLDTLGIVSRVGRGASSFAGSSEARATNVAVAAEHVSHTLIAPGDTFSFNDALGPITTDEGYVEGKIILGDWYASDLGGGVCQVSTTVFRAALLAGLPFVEWHPHSFRLAFYELDGWPVGMDAAIYQPNNAGESELDLLFTNPTDSWMLLQMHIDGETVVADLFGAQSNVEVKISDPDLGEPTAPPPAIERASEQLQPGIREQIQSAQSGVTVTMTRRIVRDGRVLSEDTFVSPYQPQPDVYLIGKPSG
ncbi:MAG TPA: VanW family protein [Thermomicrobiales bacterium]|nr:VanW family protein [Thermomicrobiales bacterium]